MRVLALITARGGSKRIPGKNLKKLAGVPLISWSIRATHGIPAICNVLVSTDDPAIARIAVEEGAMVPWLRPACLATDTASPVDVCLHALSWYEEALGTVDALLLLQPTSPFRSSRTIRRGLELFSSKEHRPVIGVSPVSAHPMWCFSLSDGRLRPFVHSGGLHLRSQDLPPAYVVNGAFYLIAPEDLRRNRSFYSDDMVPLIIESPKESIDIDSPWDWTIAEAVAGEH